MSDHHTFGDVIVQAFCFIPAISLALALCSILTPSIFNKGSWMVLGQRFLFPKEDISYKRYKEKTLVLQRGVGKPFARPLVRYKTLTSLLAVSLICWKYHHRSLIAYIKFVFVCIFVCYQTSVSEEIWGTLCGRSAYRVSNKKLHEQLRIYSWSSPSV